jgi:hypothetical protein
MSDPPVHHNPPPFTAEDIRISPSGPYVPGSGLAGLIRFGADAVVQDLTLPTNLLAASPINRKTTPAAPLAVTFPAWGSGDVLWVVWHASGIIFPNTALASLRIFPVVNIGAGPKMINNAEVYLSKEFFTAGEGFQEEGVSLAGTAAIRITDPAQPPVVQLFYQFQDESNPGSSVVTIPGILPTEGSGSCWLTCAELATSVVFQLPPEVALTAIV